MPPTFIWKGYCFSFFFFSLLARCKKYMQSNCVLDSIVLRVPACHAENRVRFPIEEQTFLSFRIFSLHVLHTQSSIYFTTLGSVPYALCEGTTAHRHSSVPYNLAQPLGLHYDHYINASLCIRGQLVEMLLITVS